MEAANYFTYRDSHESVDLNNKLQQEYMRKVNELLVTNQKLKVNDRDNFTLGIGTPSP
jgi:hypothetical protein